MTLIQNPFLQAFHFSVSTSVSKASAHLHIGRRTRMLGRLVRGRRNSYINPKLGTGYCMTSKSSGRKNKNFSSIFQNTFTIILIESSEERYHVNKMTFFRCKEIKSLRYNHSEIHSPKTSLIQKS